MYYCFVPLWCASDSTWCNNDCEWKIAVVNGFLRLWHIWNARPRRLNCILWVFHISAYRMKIRNEPKPKWIDIVRWYDVAHCTSNAKIKWNEISSPVGQQKGWKGSVFTTLLTQFAFISLFYNFVFFVLRHIYFILSCPVLMHSCYLSTCLFPTMYSIPRKRVHKVSFSLTIPLLAIPCFNNLLHAHTFNSNKHFYAMIRNPRSFQC